MDLFFPEIKKNFGFGCMRLPMNEGEVDTAEFSKMVDAFLAAGFNYFDTAHGYLSEKSEPALRACLTSRYPRESYILTDKLSGNYFESEADIRPLFEKQLAACGVSYFDFYLMHAQGSRNFDKYKQCRAYETALALKQEGKIRHLGISFHDKADVLDRILTEYPQVEVVQIQFNYLDYNDACVQSRKCYEVCRKHQKPVIVMEPVKGGRLAMLPPDARAVLDTLNPNASSASYALRFAAGFEGVAMVLSGMGDMNMMRDNLGSMTDFAAFTARERAAVWAVRDILRRQEMISCTACRYCTDGCPKQIDIPALFAAYNATRQNEEPVLPRKGGKASDCLGCGKCEQICPQKLPIRELLGRVKREFED